MGFDVFWVPPELCYAQAERLSKSSPCATQDVPLRCPTPPALPYSGPPGAAQFRIQPTALPRPPSHSLLASCLNFDRTGSKRS